MEYIYKNFILLFAVLIISTFTLSLHAASRITSISDVEYRGKIEYKNAGYELSYAQSHEQKFKRIVEQARELTDKELELYIELGQELDAEFGSKLERYDLDFDGPIVVELIGQSNGSVTAKIGGFNISSLVSLDYGLLGDAELSVSTNTLWLTGNYNIATGQITQLDDSQIIVNLNIDIDGLLDFFTLGLLSYAIENVLVDYAEDYINTTINDTLAGANGSIIFSLDETIPDNTYVFGEVDAGMEIRELIASSFADLVSGESFRIAVEKIPLNYNAVAPAGPTNENPYYTTVPVTYNKHKISINVSDHLFFEVNDTPKFSYKYANCSWVYCYTSNAPTFDDPANTPENPTDITIERPNGDTITIPYGLDFDINSLHLLFEANEPPTPSNSGEVMARGGSFGWGTNPNCIWVGVSGGADLKCFSALVAKQRTYSGSYGSSSYTILTLIDSTNYLLQMNGSYPNFKITAK